MTDTSGQVQVPTFLLDFYQRLSRIEVQLDALISSQGRSEEYRKEVISRLERLERKEYVREGRIDGAERFGLGIAKFIKWIVGIALIVGGWAIGWFHSKGG